jgi:hypothetical protein
LYSPDTAQVNKRGPRPRDSAFLTDLTQYCPSLDKVCVATEGYDGRRIRWGFWSFCDGAVVSASRLGPFATHQEGHGDDSMKLSIDRAVDDPGLEARVCVA